MTDKNTGLSEVAAEGSAIAESYRFLRTNLFFFDAREVQAVMITSALPGEGKSTIAGNLAVVCADAHKRVLLVDSDLRKPTQHVYFGMNNSSGLAQALRQPGPGSEYNLELKVHQARPGLDLLTSGPLPASPPDRLASGRMAELVSFVRREYDLIIFDSPSVLAVTDPVVLARYVDGVILVVRAAHTRREHAAEALRQLARTNTNVLGVVLNSMSPKKGYGREGNYLRKHRKNIPQPEESRSTINEADSANTLPQRGAGPAGDPQGDST